MNSDLHPAELSWVGTHKTRAHVCTRAHAHTRAHTSATSYLGSPRALSQKVILCDVFAHASSSILQQTNIHPTSQTCLSPLAPNPKESQRWGKHYLYTKILTAIAESCRSDSVPVPGTAHFVVSSKHCYNFQSTECRWEKLETVIENCKRSL